MIKKLILTLFATIILGCGSLLAENHRIYAVIVYDGRGGVALIQETTTVTAAGNLWSSFNYKENCLRDEDGKELKFNNFLPVLGYVESIGWTIPDKEEQIYKNIANTISGRLTFLLFKEVTEEEWLQWIEKGMAKKQ